MNEFLQALVDGVALGAQYSLIVLGFVVIFRATGIINFAQGGLVLLGAYLTYNAHATWGLNFYLSILISMVLVAAVGVLIQRSILQLTFRETGGVAAGLLAWAVAQYAAIETWPAFGIGIVVGVAAWALLWLLERRSSGSKYNELPIFGAVMVTIGLLFAVKQLVASVWGFAELTMGDPWALSNLDVGDLSISHAKLWTIGLAIVGLGIFFVFDRFTKIGIAMRAVHFDQEAAVAQGIPTGLVFGVAWGIAGAVAALAGATAGAGVAQLTPQLDLVVFLAFPAIILGGFDSPVGAVVGGVIIGVVQNLVKVYQLEAWGVGFDRVGIFIVMILVLMVRPYGLFGTPEVRRV